MSAKDLKIRPYPIVLDKQRNLTYDLNAFEELENLYESEQVFDKDGNEIESPLSKALESLQTSKKRMKHLKNFLFAGLVHEDKTLTPEIVGKLIGYQNITDVTNSIWEAVSNSMPESKNESEDSEGE